MLIQNKIFNRDLEVRLDQEMTKRYPAIGSLAAGLACMEFTKATNVPTRHSLNAYSANVEFPLRGEKLTVTYERKIYGARLTEVTAYGRPIAPSSWEQDGPQFTANIVSRGEGPGVVIFWFEEGDHIPEPMAAYNTCLLIAQYIAESIALNRGSLVPDEKLRELTAPYLILITPSDQ